MIKKFALAGFLYLIIFSAQAQFKNIKIDEAGNRMGEPYITVNPDDPKNLVASGADDTIFYSTDGGATWEKTKLTSSLGIYGGLVLIADSKGTIYCLHSSNPGGEGLSNEKALDQIVCHASSDGGKTWEEVGSVGYNPPKDQARPFVTMDAKGGLYLTWTQFDKYKSTDATCQSTVLISTSSNGKKWSKPVVLSQTPGNCNDTGTTTGVATPTVAPDGKVYVTWPLQNKIFLDRSFDGGGVWLMNDVPTADQTGGWSLKVPGYSHSNEVPMLMVDKSKSTYRGCLYLVWADQRNGENDTNVWFSRSYNYGDNWSSPVKMGSDSTAKHQFMSKMAVDPLTGYIYIVYYDRSAYEDNQTDVYLAYSADSGANFKSVKISESPFVAEDVAGFGDYTNISAQNGIITPIWVRTDNGKTSLLTSVIKQEELIPPTPTEKGKKKK